MSYSQYKVHELVELLNKKEVSAREVAEDAFKLIEEKDGDIGAFLTLNKEAALKKADQVDKKRAANERAGLLAGVPMALKDNISTKDLLTTAGSKMLYNYLPPFNARVVDMLDQEDALLLGKLNMDEFAMGSSNETSAYKLTKNPLDLSRVPGGSSGGPAAAVASGQAFFSLGSDTGGSIRQPAAFCGLVGLKPSYGSVSRRGLIAMAPSMDQIGPLTKDVRDSALVYSAIAGYDKEESTSAKRDYPDFTQALTSGVKGMKIGLPKEFFDLNLTDDVKKSWERAAKELADMGAIVEECSLPNSKYAAAAYYIISAAEASSDLARYDGVRYGLRSEKADSLLEMFLNTREEGFGSNVKTKLLLGAYALSADNYEKYYMQALRARRMVKEDFDGVFANFDLLLTPTTPDVAFKFGQVKDAVSMQLQDICTIPANLAGLPALSLPWGKSDGMPVGLQLMGPLFSEEKIFAAAYELEGRNGGRAE